MKKHRNLMFLAALLLAVGSSFAFTTKKARNTYIVYYQDRNGLCQDNGELDDPDDLCDPSNSGAVCTFLDPETPPQRTTAYADEFGTLCNTPYRQLY